MRKDRRTLLAAGFLGLTMGTSLLAFSKPRVVRIVARRFVFTPNQIALKKGEPVTFELTTADIPMGMNIPDFGVRSDIVPGRKTELTFTPGKAGTFTFVCDVFCGDGHEDMSGKLVVT
jgi:cytochrome c oxidase subunit 2